MLAMNKIGLLFICGFIISCATVEESGRMITLFDGSSLENWSQLGDAEWHIVGDYVEGSGEGGHLITQGSYDDFRLTLEFWTDEPANSGIFVRCSDRQEITSSNCYEVNIFDTREDQTYRTGGIVNLAAPAAKIDAANQWNTYEIFVQGPRIIVTLNGIETVNIEDEKLSSGPITLQYGRGVVRFRNIKILRL